MLLEGGIPEVFRKVLLADGKADAVRLCVAREGEREADLDGGAVGPLALALESQRVRDSDAGRFERGRIRRRVRLSRMSRESPSWSRQKRWLKRAEQRGESVGAELLGLGDRQQLDEEARQLHDTIVGAPGMPVARADEKTEQR